MTSRHPLGLRARLSKLQAMSAAELLHRAQYRAIVGVERWQYRSERLTHPDRLRRAISHTLRNSDWEACLIASRLANRSRFFASVGEQTWMRRLFETTYARERTETARHAANARRHRFEFFGRQFEYGDTIAWQADPITGRAWPSLHHVDVPVHAGDLGYGDVKYVWELNRQQFLIDLGKAWFLTENPEDLAAIKRLVRSWIAGNPYATGVNWSCALEPAFRVFSWLWAYYLSVTALDREFHLEWLRGFYDHGRFIERHLEHHSSPYNHLIAEAAALYMLGACFPEFRESGRWRARGRAVLEGRLDEQFYGDGGSVEQSTFYHHATMGFYLLAGLTARATGEELSGDIWQAIERGLEFSMTLSQPDGTTPAIGGADDGKPIRMEHLPFWDFRPCQAIGAVLFERPDFKAVAGRFHEDALWLLGPAALAKFDSLESLMPAEHSTPLRASGYYVMRSAWSERADYVCFDCGEQAAGIRTDAIPNAMHGHADCLSVIAWLNGRRVLVDSGFYAYNCGGEWESHFRETAAHNTARVDGRDQATHLGKMAWSHSYRATLEGWHSDGRQSWAFGSHDGYARGRDGVVHRRAVWLRPDAYLLIYDEFVGAGRHEFEVDYQFAPGDLKRVTVHSALLDDAVEIVWIGSAVWTAEVKYGGPSPQDGWIASSLGVRQAAPRLTLTCTSGEPRTSLLTVLAARSARGCRVSDHAGATGPLAAISGHDYTDWITASGIAAGGPIDTDALVSVCRVRDDNSVERHRIGGTYLHVDTGALARLAPRACSDPTVVR